MEKPTKDSETEDDDEKKVKESPNNGGNNNILQILSLAIGIAALVLAVFVMIMYFFVPQPVRKIPKFVNINATRSYPNLNPENFTSYNIVNAESGDSGITFISNTKNAFITFGINNQTNQAIKLRGVHNGDLIIPQNGQPGSLGIFFTNAAGMVIS
jgi:hypothetical protein